MKCYVSDSLANMIKRDVTESTTASDVDANVIIIIIIILLIFLNLDSINFGRIRMLCSIAMLT